MISLMQEIRHLESLGYPDEVIEDSMQETLDMFSVDTIMVTQEEAEEQAHEYYREQIRELSSCLEDYLLGNYIRQLSNLDRETICMWVEEF